MSEYELQQITSRLESHEYVLGVFGQRLKEAADVLERCSHNMQTASMSLEAALRHAIEEGRLPLPPPSKNGDGH